MTISTLQQSRMKSYRKCHQRSKEAYVSKTQNKASEDAE